MRNMTQRMLPAAIAAALSLPALGDAPGRGWPTTEPAATEASTAIPAITFRSGENGLFHLRVEGVLWDQVASLHAGDLEVTDSLQEAIESGTVRIKPLPNGFELETEDPVELGLEEETPFTLVLTSGTAISAFAPAKSLSSQAAATSCAWLSFSAPTRTAMTSGCAFGSTSCGKAGYYHTGIDYTYSSSNPYAYATADGKVVRVERLSSIDHGMGNNVIVEHTTSLCTKVYSTYSHLGSIDPAMVEGRPVARGQKVGVIGGSGYGQTSYWGRHLHFEIKKSPTTGTPWSYAGTCPWGCWGYTPHSPTNYGYTNPQNWY